MAIHRLDTDDDEAWDGVMGLLSEEDALDMTFNDDSTVTLRWEAMAGDEDHGGDRSAQNQAEPEQEEVPF
ncbi:hypothetical protein D3C76_1805710 [compost metagenome]